jgi:hypothetical protein
MERTGRFDNELCYLLRKQEALDDLKAWMKTVLVQRRAGDDQFGKDLDPLSFSKVFESVRRRLRKRQLFKESFRVALQNG